VRTLVAAAEPPERREPAHPWPYATSTVNATVTASAPLWGGTCTLASSTTTLVTFEPMAHHQT